ncbi:hypothetical protein HELRODRAFT_178814 [Helobdella robusta]|uniref:EGF-like domain-containing protein n=1 Tax=Helobdella robusta TaxID=6412 RepID=T1FDS2_HELRO|nr:hypothetical protein HELRODRAFT_178814 [Helobdella robusta]ESN95899.1 hypothetical protein HELRODRAFT_178814 [Helobdella robusta]
MTVDMDYPFHIYITDWTLRRITRSVFDPSGANLPTSSVFFEGFDGLTGLVVRNRGSSYAPSGSCKGSDESICFTSSKFVCKSKFLDQTSQKCSLSKNFVAIADLNSIKFMNLDLVAPASEINHVMTVVQGDSYMANIAALAYYNDSLIYFNIFDNTFNSLNLVTFLTTPIYRVNHIVESMLQHDNVLYWSDSNYGLICYLSLLNPSSGHKILRQKLSKPRDLAILRGELYWTEWGKSPKVAKIALPESASSVKETVIVIPSPLANLSLTWPNGLVFDGATDAIPPAMVETQLTDDITHIYDIGFINQNIFYTDMLTGSLNVIPLDTGRSSVVIDNLIRPSQFVIRYTTSPSNYCNPVVKNKVCGSDPNIACKSILGSMVECSCVDQVNYVYVKSSKACACK